MLSLAAASARIIAVKAIARKAAATEVSHIQQTGYVAASLTMCLVRQNSANAAQPLDCR